jgi:hypothetical protein
VDLVPATGSRLEVVFSNGSRCEVVVESCSASTLRAVIRDPDVLVEAATQDVPFTVGWPTERSWCVRPGGELRLIGEDARLCQIELAGEARPANRRQFVRGGGGEIIRLSDADVAGETAVDGVIEDLSEGGVRCRLKQFSGDLGDAITVAIDLSGEMIDAVGTVYDVRTLRRSAGMEVVVVYALTEPSAHKVRRYLFERELAARRQQRASALGVPRLVRDR